MAGITPISSDGCGSAPAVVEQNTPKAADTDLWIFRDGGKLMPGAALVGRIAKSASEGLHDQRRLVDALIQAGQLEAALADVNCASAPYSAALTDVLASALLQHEPQIDLDSLIHRIQTPEFISVSPPEGFTYYALHPRDFADITARVPQRRLRCALIGIRSIGTTLSAMTMAALNAKGRAAARITVRPTGHPYSRVMRFSHEEMEWIHRQLSAGSQFLIVDEGPGRSGSTFLSVAEALLEAGVPIELITLLGSRQPEPASLCAEAAERRWSRFSFLSTIPSLNSRFDDCLYAGGGEWRRILLPQEYSWPDSWTQMERLKFISKDRNTIFKFEGMGEASQEARSRITALANRGFGLLGHDADGGFIAYPLVRGRNLRTNDLSMRLLDHMAQYCTFRAREFRVSNPAPEELQRMLTFNIQIEFGIDIQLPECALVSDAAVLTDGRMQPHEWIALESGRLLKTDAIHHGDNHFAPGPCDIAWDLAGAAVEWQLTDDAMKYLVRKFQSVSGKDVSSCIDPYMLAYCIFRLGFCKMAASAATDVAEKHRLTAAYHSYRAKAQEILLKFSSSNAFRLAP